MPKLNKTQAKAVNDAESSFEPIEDGVYHVRLREVEAVTAKSGNPMWKVEFEIVEEPYVNRRLWTNLVQVEAALFKTNEFFAAFDVPPTTDTDELCGQVCRAVVSTRTIQEGARKGEISNQIDRLSPADDEFEAPEADAIGAGAAKGDGGEDLF
jgi:hypothetical protein